MELGCVWVWVDMDNSVLPCGGVARQSMRGACNLKVRGAQSLLVQKAADSI